MSLLDLTHELGRIALHEPPPPLPQGLSRLRALVLLGGAVRSSQLAEATQRSPLDLPIDHEHSLLDLWRAHAMVQVAHARLNRLAVRVITNGIAPSPGPDEGSVAVTVENDPYELRGAGGVLRDIADAYDDDDIVAVAAGAQVLYDSLPHLLAELGATGADVALVAHEDGTPGGLMLARCRSLRCIPLVGYVDMKEQALPLIARKSAVKAIKRRRPVGMGVRTLGDYIGALRRYHEPGDAVQDAFAESWSPVFSICEPGAVIDASARIHDSVALRGSRVEVGAVVVRSVVCPGAVVAKNQVVVDQLVCK